MYAINKTYN